MSLLHVVLLLPVVIGAALLIGDPQRPRRSMAFARYTALVIIATVILTPFAWLITAVFKHDAALMQYSFLPPIERWSETLGFDNFRKLFQPRPSLNGQIGFLQYLLNSLFLAGAATSIQLLFCSMGGYALAKYPFRGRRSLMLFMMGSMMIPQLLLLAPVYSLIVGIGWIDTYAALLVPGAAGAFGIFLFRQAIVAVPDSLLEAARIDGAGEFFIYYRIVMPLVRPMTAAFCLIIFMGQWNAFIAPQVYLQSGYKLPLPVVLTQYAAQFAEDYGIFLAGTFVSILPIAILFLILQREFIAGLTSGAVKG